MSSDLKIITAEVNLIEISKDTITAQVQIEYNNYIKKNEIIISITPMNRCVYSINDTWSETELMCFISSLDSIKAAIVKKAASKKQKTANDIVEEFIDNNSNLMYLSNYSSIDEVYEAVADVLPNGYKYELEYSPDALSHLQELEKLLMQDKFSDVYKGKYYWYLIAMMFVSVVDVHITCDNIKYYTKLIDKYAG